MIHKECLFKQRFRQGIIKLETKTKSEKINKMKYKIIIKIFSNQSGSLLFATILILTAILSAILTASNLMMSGIVMSGTQMQSTKAYFAAEAGVERSLNWARSKNTASTSLENNLTNLFPDILNNGAKYAVNYTTWGNVRNFAANGEFGATRRTVETQYGFIHEPRIINECSVSHPNLCLTVGACSAIGGIWADNICSIEPKEPIINQCGPGRLSLCLDQGRCEAAGGTWDGDSCL